MKLHLLTEWARRMPAVIDALKAAGFDASTLAAACMPAVEFIGKAEEVREARVADFEAARQDPALSVEVVEGALRGRRRTFIVRHTKASVWLADHVDSGGVRYSIRTGGRLGCSSWYSSRIDWSTTTHQGLLAAREAAS